MCPLWFAFAGPVYLTMKLLIYVHLPFKTDAISESNT